MDANDFLSYTADNVANNVAVKYKDTQYSYHVFLKRVRTLAAALSNFGVKRYDKVILVGDNCPEYIEVTFACLWIGAISEHINVRYTPAKLCETIESSSAVLIFTTRNGLCDKFKQDLKRDVRVVLINNENMQSNCDYDFDNFVETFNFEGRLESRYYFSENDVCMQFYTSGSTGKPKGVLITHKNIISLNMKMVVLSECRPDDKSLCVVPFFHIALITVFHTFFMGSTLVISPSTKVEEIVELFISEKISRTVLVPTLMKSIVMYLQSHGLCIKSLQHISYAGAPITKELLNDCMRQLPDCKFSQGYGMTETTGTVTLLNAKHHEDPTKLGSVGKAIVGNRIKIISEDGKECKAKEVGEIVVCSDTVMKGYTDHALSEAVLKNGWLHTGDIGYLDENDFLYIVGRKHDMIISGGENIFPEEIANCIRKMSPEIVDVQVLGLPHQSWGEAVTVAAVMHEKSTIGKKEIMEYCRNELDAFKQPKDIFFVEKMPYKEMGKLDREGLKTLLLDMKKEVFER